MEAGYWSFLLFKWIFAYYCRLICVRHTLIHTYIKQLSGSKSSKTKKSKLCLHSATIHHLKAMSSWLDYKLSLKHGSVVSKIAIANKDHIEKNRQYVKFLIDIVTYLGRQGLPFRGHREDDNSLNKG